METFKIIVLLVAAVMPITYAIISVIKHEKDNTKFEVNLDKYLCLRAFNDLSRDPPEKSNVGICGQVERYLNSKDFAKMHFLFSTWKHFSGNEYYPVPSDVHGMNAISCFNCKSANRSLWIGKQLEYRQDLIRHIIINWS